MTPDGKAPKLMDQVCSVTLSRLGRMFSWVAFTWMLDRMDAVRSVPAIVLDHVC